jgi:hypothetical protein
MATIGYIKDDGGREAAGYEGDAGDCVCRAIVIASGRPYREVYDRLAEGNATQRKTKRSSNDTPIPTDWYDEISTTWAQRNVPATDAVFRGLVDKTGAPVTGDMTAVYPVDSVGLPRNSALDCFDPSSTEREDGIEVVTLTTYKAEYNNALYPNIQNAVNNAEYVLDRSALGYTFTWAPYTARLTVSSTAERTNQIRYIKVVYTFQIDHRMTWRRRYLDQGKRRYVAVGSVDGRGQTITQDYIDRFGPWVPILEGQTLRPITEPVRLNGGNRVPAANGPDVYLEYSLYPNEIDFSTLNLNGESP